MVAKALIEPVFFPTKLKLAAAAHELLLVLASWLIDASYFGLRQSNLGRCPL